MVSKEVVSYGGVARDEKYKYWIAKFDPPGRVHGSTVKTVFKAFIDKNFAKGRY